VTASRVDDLATLACKRALPWLAELAGEHDSESGGGAWLARRLRLLSGAWVAESALPYDDLGLTRRLADALERELQAPSEAELARQSPELVGLGATAAAAAGVPLDSLTEFLEGAAGVVASAAGGSAGEFALFWAVTSALVPQAGGPAAAPLAPVELIADEEARRATADRVAAHTRFGAVPARDLPSGDYVDVLSVWLLFELRRYDLQAAAALMRALTWCAPDAPILEAAASYLARQQHPTGRIGFLAPELARMDRAIRVKSAWEVYLPLTLQVLWALRTPGRAPVRFGSFRDA
jgi:hypothetical protein